MAGRTRSVAWLAFVALAAAGYATICSYPVFHDSAVAAVLLIASTTAWIVTGTSALSVPRMRQLGVILIVSGLLWRGQTLATWGSGPAPVLSIIANTCIYMTSAVLLFRYPSEMKRTRSETLFLVCFFSYFTLVSILGVVLTQPEWFGFDSNTWWWPSFSVEKHWFDSLRHITLVLDSVTSIAFLMLIILRLNRMPRLDRIATAPIALGFCALAGISAALSSKGWYIADETAPILTSLVSLAVPVGFVIARIRIRLEHAAVSNKLHKELARNESSSDTLQSTLRETLNDDSLELFYWSEATNAYVDTAGNLFDAESQADNRLVKPIDALDGSPLAIITTDSFMERHRIALDVAVDISRLTIENAKLHTSVEDRLVEVQESRARVATAELQERRRIERDLHDGVQQRLLAVGLQVGTARRTASNTDTARILDEALDDLTSSIQMIRDLARGIHPPDLDQFGLAVAIGELVARLPFDIEVNFTERRFTSALEATVYFVVCEALNNVAKHADATHVTIAGRVTGDVLAVEVSDNGVGGADSNGHGLIGISDRVASIGGSILLKSDASGTILRVDAPMQPAVGDLQ